MLLNLGCKTQQMGIAPDTVALVHLTGHTHTWPHRLLLFNITINFEKMSKFSKLNFTLC